MYQSEVRGSADEVARPVDGWRWNLATRATHKVAIFWELRGKVAGEKTLLANNNHTTGLHM